MNEARLVAFAFEMLCFLVGAWLGVRGEYAKGTYFLAAGIAWGQTRDRLVP